MRSICYFALCMLVSVAAFSAGIQSVDAAPKQDPGAPIQATVVEYSGKMVDEAGKPVSGIYPITFKLYPSGKGGKAVWTDQMWVGVTEGTYKVGLGSAKLLPQNQDFTKLMLAVEIKGRELSRETFMDPETAKKVAADQAARMKAVSDVKLVETPKDAKQPAGNTGSVKYADSAGYAVAADHAKNADRIQNLTVDDLMKKIAEEGGGGGSGNTGIGSTRRYGDRVGGPGGDYEYNQVCPKGYVMVGVRGGAGKFLDSIQIICAPIESK